MNSRDTIVKTVLLSLAALSLIVLLGFDLYSIRSKNKEASRLLNLTEESSKGEVASQSIRIQREASKEEIEAFEAIALSEAGLVSVIESLESAGRTLGLVTEIISVTQEGEVPAGEPQKIRIVVEGIGGWGGAYSLLKAVESLPQRVIIEEASLTKDGTAWKSRIDFSLHSFN